MKTLDVQCMAFCAHICSHARCCREIFRVLTHISLQSVVYSSAHCSCQSQCKEVCPRVPLQLQSARPALSRCSRLYVGRMQLQCQSSPCSRKAALRQNIMYCCIIPATLCSHLQHCTQRLATSSTLNPCVTPKSPCNRPCNCAIALPP